MAVSITGGSSPGNAWGKHSGFDIGQGPGGGGNVWGMLKRKQQMQEQQAA